MMNGPPDASDDREERLNAAILAYLTARGSGRTPEPESFLNAYPDLREELSAFLEAQGVIDAVQAAGKTPDAFGHYRVVRPINQGGYGEIYLCQDTVLNRPVAVKVLKAKHATAPESVARFQEEARIASQLEHPGIPPVHELGELLDGRPYFCMKLIQGRDLADELKRRTSPAEDLPRFLAIFQQICQTVAYVHREKQVLHRDLKPLNVMVGAFGEVQVMDWGLGKALALDVATHPNGPSPDTARSVGAVEQTQQGVVRGTLAYMPPEQARAELSRQGKWSDVFSLGAMLCEILTGEPPYTISATVAPKQAKARLWEMAKRPELAPAWERLQKCGADDELIQLARSCLNAEPTRRPPDAQAVADAMAAYLEGVRERLRQAELARAKTEAKRRLQLGLVAVMLIGGAVVGWQRLSSETDRRVAAEKEASAEIELRHQAEALAEAERQKQQAERQRLQVELRAAHSARVTAARQAGRRGDWPTALGAYDRAIRDGETDAVRLRVERLVGYFALNNIPHLTGELDVLGQLDLGNSAAQVKLIRGAWLLCDSARQREGRALVQEALKQRQDLFSPADVALAEALAADRVGPALTSLRKAVDADPLHYLAATSLAVAFAAAGERDEARRQARFLRGVFPFSPMPYLVDAIVALMECDRAELKKQLAQVAANLPPDRRATIPRLEEFLLLVIELEEITIRYSAGDDLDKLRAIVLIAKINVVGGLPNAEPLGLPAPTVSLLFRRLHEIFSVYLEVVIRATVGAVTKDMLARLESSNDECPDTGLLVLASFARGLTGAQALKRGEFAAGCENLKASAKLSEQAAKAPSIVPRAPFRYHALWLGAVADMAVFKMTRHPEPCHIQRLRANLHLLVAEGQQWPKIRQRYLPIFIEITATALSGAEAVDWNLNDLAGKEAYTKRMRDLAVIGRALVDDWAIDEPDNPAIGRLREALTKWAASSGILEEANKPPAKE